MFDPSAKFQLEVLPNGRRPADEYFHQNSMWIEGRENSVYTLKFTNRSSTRVLVILSVDGLDVIKGQPAGPNSEGYVVNANDTLEVKGWKLNNNSAAEFVFSKAGKSYVAASGNDTSNTGVIGAMVFRERQQITWTSPYAYTGLRGMYGPQGSGMSTGSINSVDYISSASLGTTSVTKGITPVAQSLVTQDVGTGFGDAVDFNTYTINFEREDQNNPDAVLALYYNTAKNLERMGIVLRSKNSIDTSGSANPFPAYYNGVKPPPGWTP